MKSIFNPIGLGAAVFLFVLVIAEITRLLAIINRRRLVRNLMGPPPLSINVVEEGLPSSPQKLIDFVIRISPKGLQEISKRQLLRAGLYGVRPRTVLFLTELTLFLLYISALISQLPNRGMFFIVLFLGALVLLSPRIGLKIRARVRASTMARELPGVLDLLLLVVSGGLGLTAGMKKVIVNNSGLLTGELTRTLDDLLLGVDRETAFTDLANRTGSPEVRRFADAIMKVDQLGVSLTTVLLAQANEMRHRNRIEAREQAQRISVKILFPLILCFLPGLFIVVLGPALIDIFASIGL